MGRFKTIQYALDLDTGLVCSRVNGKIAIPVLDFAGMSPKNNFETNYDLEKFDILDSAGMDLKWTRKIVLTEKNKHREFWGMKLLKDRK